MKFIRGSIALLACAIGLTAAEAVELASSTNDARLASSTCSVNKEFLLICDYRYSSKLNVKEVQVEIDGKKVQISPDRHQLFPAAGQAAAILILADVSDPRRRNTVESKYATTISQLLNSSNPNHLVGLAEFDSEFRIVTPIGSNGEAVTKAAQSLKATGQATEFYKNVLSAIDELKKTKAERKGLVILSDGKDEDRVYKFDDVIKQAKDAQVSILSLGYLESAKDTPFLQSLKRLADETHGLYYEVVDGKLPLAITGKPLSFIDRGGRLSYQLDKAYDPRVVTINLGKAGGDTVRLDSTVAPLDERPKTRKILDFASANWMWLTAATFCTLLLAGISIYWIWKRARRAAPTIFATLVEMNSVGTKHQIRQSAVRIGRGEDNDIQVKNDSISMHHAEIHRRREGGFYIVDFSSTNGIYLNDQKISQGELKDNDIIEMGEIRLRFGLVT